MSERNRGSGSDKRVVDAAEVPWLDLPPGTKITGRVVERNDGPLNTGSGKLYSDGKEVEG